MAVRTVILLSVKPSRAELIYSGDKKVEVRKMMIHRWSSPVLLYESDPVSKVTGTLRFSCRREVRTDDGLVCSDACLTAKEMSRYGKGHILYAYDIVDVKRFDEPMTLEQLGIEGVPSPSYRYVQVQTGVLA